jgi:hypothetical protein
VGAAIAQSFVKKLPTFPANAELARWVHEANLGAGGRVSSSAFMPQDDHTGKPEKYFSVNSVEVEPLPVIAEYYRAKFLDGGGPVYLASLKVLDYVKASTHGGVPVTKIAGRWMFNSGGKEAEAFMHRPSTHKDAPSASHCGVETIELMDEDARAKFARRLAGRPPGANPHKF